MKRKTVGTILLLGTLMCFMGADTIDWDNGQPKGTKGAVTGAGPYKLDPNHTLIGITLWAEKGGFTDESKATTAAGKWDATTIVTGGAGNYKCWGSMYLDDGQKIWSVKTPTEPVVAVQ